MALIFASDLVRFVPWGSGEARSLPWHNQTIREKNTSEMNRWVFMDPVTRILRLNCHTAHYREGPSALPLQACGAHRHYKNEKWACQKLRQALAKRLACGKPLRMLLLHFPRQPTTAQVGAHVWVWGRAAAGRSILNELI